MATQAWISTNRCEAPFLPAPSCFCSAHSHHHTRPPTAHRVEEGVGQAQDGRVGAVVAHELRDEGGVVGRGGALRTVMLQ